MVAAQQPYQPWAFGIADKGVHDVLPPVGIVGCPAEHFINVSTVEFPFVGDPRLPEVDAISGMSYLPASVARALAERSLTG
jgi:hypothetical protein